METFTLTVLGILSALIATIIVLTWRQVVYEKFSKNPIGKRVRYRMGNKRYKGTIVKSERNRTLITIKPDNYAIQHIVWFTEVTPLFNRQNAQ